MKSKIPDDQDQILNSSTHEEDKRGLGRRDFMKIAGLAGAAGVVAGSGVGFPVFAAKPKLSTPTITCIQETQHTIFLKVCAGATGAPAGFSVQWVKRSDFPAIVCDGAGTGPNNDDPNWPSSSGGSICKASFSGTPGCSIYNLAPNACITVEIGNLNDAECGVGLDNCGAGELECGTEYVFRAFAHANSSNDRSKFTNNHCCSTEACVAGCVHTQGYWKTHPCQWPSPFVPGVNGADNDLDGSPDAEGNCANTGNPNQQCACDNANTINIGSLAYNQCQLLCAFDRPGGGNALVILAHQLIAAKLNILDGAAPPPNCDIAAADALIGSLDILTASVPAGGPGNTLGPAMTAAAGCLDLYNNSDGGVSHCA